MKLRELLLGGGIAAMLIAGVVVTRGLGHDETAPVAFDLTGVDGEFVVDDITVEVAARPRPLRVFDRLRFDFRFVRAGEAVDVTDPRVGFNMTMDMGPHDYRLVRDEAGVWFAQDVVLPRCGSGSRIWFAELTFSVEDRSHAALLRLELDPPRAD